MRKPSRPLIGFALAIALATIVTGATGDMSETLSLDFTDAKLSTILEAIGEKTGLQFAYDFNVDPEARASISITDVSVLDALRYVTRSTRHFFVLRDSQPVLIAPDTRQKRQHYMPRDVRTFELEYASPRTAVTLLRSMLQARDIDMDEERRTVTMDDTVEQLDLAGELLERLDLASGRSPDVRPQYRKPLWIGSNYSQGLRSVGDPIPRLEVEEDRPVTLSADDSTADRVYRRLAETVGIQFVFDDEFDRARPADFVMPEMPFSEALDFVNERFGTFAVVWGPRTVFIVPDEEYRRESEEHAAIQFFYLDAAEPRDVVTTLRTTFHVRQIAEIRRLNAVAARDTVATLEAMQDVVERMDSGGAEAASD